VFFFFLHYIVIEGIKAVITYIISFHAHGQNINPHPTLHSQNEQI